MFFLSRLHLFVAVGEETQHVLLLVAISVEKGFMEYEFFIEGISRGDDGWLGIKVG